MVSASWRNWFEDTGSARGRSASRSRGARAGARGLEPGAVERAKGAERLQAPGDLRAGRIDEQHEPRALFRDDSEERAQALRLERAQRAARAAILDERRVHRPALEHAPAHGEIARRLAHRLEGDRSAQGLEEGRFRNRAHSASARTDSGWRALRPVPAAICRRPLAPPPTIVAPGAPPTPGRSPSPALFH